MGGRVALLLIRDQRIERSLNPVGRGFFRRRFGDDLQHRRSGRMQAQHHAPSSEDLGNQGAALYVALERTRVKDVVACDVDRRASLPSRNELLGPANPGGNRGARGRAADAGRRFRTTWATLPQSAPF
jgi:hypothetical protein